MVRWKREVRRRGPGRRVMDKGGVLRLRLCRQTHEEIRLPFLRLQSSCPEDAHGPGFPCSYPVAVNEFGKPEESLANS